MDYGVSVIFKYECVSLSLNCYFSAGLSKGGQAYGPLNMPVSSWWLLCCLFIVEVPLKPPTNQQHVAFASTDFNDFWKECYRDSRQSNYDLLFHFTSVMLLHYTWQNMETQKSHIFT